MKVLTAPEPLRCDDLPAVFLAGGITGCPPWQDEVIDFLRPYDAGVILNPRRKNFPIHDPNAAREQIEWEFHALNMADLFSIWFAGGDSVQPIALYELGRHVMAQYYTNDLETVVIGVDNGYKRAQDVFIQMELIDPGLSSRISTNIKVHAINICNALSLIK